MKTKFISAGILAGLLTASSAFGCGPSPKMYATQALSTNAATASNAIVMLRSLGRAGLDAVLQTFEDVFAKQRGRDGDWERARAVLDAVGGQRDCYASRLFWHTNFDQAKAEAAHTEKPILSLRLLGNLDEELSCANSRFFRTTLYSNREVSDYLREHFVLHWKSVRPAPRVRIDMGDGRTIERTITGNSIHYVLDAKGDVIDGLPGLYGANAFLAGLKKAEQIAQAAIRLGGTERETLLHDYHTIALANINQRWANDVLSAGLDLSDKTVTQTNGTVVRQRHPAAAAAMPLALTKAVVERPLLRALVPRREALERSMDESLWTAIAALHTNDVVLDANTLALIRAKRPFGARTERMQQHRLQPMLADLKRSIAGDTVRNEYIFHSKIHEWLAISGAKAGIGALNSRVYAELFLTPESDPWLGLAPQNTFSALENDGMIQSPASQAQATRPGL